MRGQISIVNEIKIEKLVYGGDGLARLNGKVVLTPFVLPGETARVQTVQETAGMIRARLVEIIEPSPHRLPAPCPYFARCGGCHYQHAPYEKQVEWKRAILEEALRRIGKFEPPEEIVLVAGPPWEYRNRMQFHLRGGRIGLYQAGSHRLEPIEHCPISAPKINEALAVLRRMTKQERFPSFLRSLELFTNGAEVQLNVLETAGHGVARGFFEWCAKWIPGAQAATLDYPAIGETFRVGHRSFFQVNRFLIDSLVETALQGAEGESAFDLYAGVGLFSLPLARRFRAVRAVESTRGAFADLKHNAERSGLPVEAARATAESFLKSLERTPDFVLADPPRSGLGHGVVRQLLRIRPPRITVVSCDPSTLARDMAALVTGAYQIDALALVDLFPQTYHIEAVATLTLR